MYIFINTIEILCLWCGSISQLPKTVNTLPSSEYTDSYANSVVENAVHLTAKGKNAIFFCYCCCIYMIGSHRKKNFHSLYRACNYNNLQSLQDGPGRLKIERVTQLAT